MRAYSHREGYRRGGPASNKYTTVSVAELDRQSTIASKELPLYRDQAYLDEYHEMKTAGMPALAALDEIYRIHPELAFPTHEHDAVLDTTGRRRFTEGEVDDNLVEIYICRICGIKL